MELNPHDLLQIKEVTDLISYTTIPEWVEGALNNAPFVVVRRVHAPKGLCAIGVRGSTRSERFGAFLDINKIVKRIKPEQLVDERNWKNNTKEIFRCLDQIDNILKKYSLSWGPAGSVGFELASGKDTVTEKSDVDIIIHTTEGLPLEIAKEIKQEFDNIPYRPDVQVEFEEGAFSLIEYIQSEGKSILLRTANGPMLKRVSILGLKK
ncbi:MAG TPA: malonate decarboxylase holo-ACP synthase [Bacillales bacterium]|nr:malonate decarboxylase holo-ACP synthase [Bacillales bacterium]